MQEAAPPDVLQEPQALGARLTKAIRPLPVRRAIVGLSTDASTVTAVAGSEVSPDVAQNDADQLAIRMGCLVKLFTATLVLDAVNERIIDLDAPLAEYLLEFRDRLAHGQGVTVRHLLEHTHGIDDSLLGTHRPAGSGRIDLESLWQWIPQDAPTSAGQLYSYSHLGSWLLGAVLERRLDRRYTDILGARLLQPMGVQPRSPDGQPLPGEYSISPSFESELSLSARELVRLLGHCVRLSLRCRSRTVTELPGWSAVERGICLGWKAYGEDWFGHASDLREHLTIVKAHPERGAVLLVSSADYAPSAIMSAVFGDRLPRSHQLRLPRMLSVQERGGLEFDRYIATYENAAVTVTLSRSGSDTLTIRITPSRSSRNAASPELVSEALPARDDLFVCRSAAGDFAIFQLVNPDKSGFRYLWNGKTALRRSRPQKAVSQ